MANEHSTEVENLRRTVSELRRQIDAIRGIATALSTAVKTEDLAREALEISLGLVAAEAGSILLYYPDRDRLVFEHVIGGRSRELRGMEISPDQGLAGRVFTSGETYVSDDVTGDPAHLRTIAEAVGYTTSNMVSVALRSPDDRPLGVMQVLNKRGPGFDEHDVRLIETVAAQIAVAVKTSRLYEQARLAAIVRFIGDISHDVKNMITPAITGAETLRMIADQCFEDFDRSVSMLRDSGAPVGDLPSIMDDLRSLCPEITDMIVEGGGVVQERMVEITSAVKGIVSKPQFEPIDVVSIARRVGAVLSPHAAKKGLTLAIEAIGETPVAAVDAKQIYNAIYNLVFNAIDACRDGDSVTFSLSCRPDGLSPGERCLVLECADTGPGIPDDIKAKLFTDDAVSTKPMGTGLGTRIVKNVVDAHEGRVEVESRVGEGTTIRCLLPLRRQVAQ